MKTATLLIHYRVPPPKESITELEESPLEQKHSAFEGLCYSSCVTEGRIVVIEAGNGQVERRLPIATAGSVRATGVEEFLIAQAKPDRGQGKQ